MWVYEIISGRLYSEDGEHIGTGYSGKGASKNNPAAQSLHNEGPIPVGLYTVGIPVNTIMHGPYVLPLTPDTKNLMWGRFGFLMHSDSIQNPGSASEGCIILPHSVRQTIWESLDRTLEVIAQKEQ